jgi:hypothetical protein
MALMDRLTGQNNFKARVAMGLVPRWEVFRKFGMNDAVISGTGEMWPQGGLRTLPTSAAVAAVVSDSVNDDAAGTGAQTIIVEGLDSDYLQVSETVTMDGITPVNTTQTFLRVNRAYNVTAGSGEINAGNISISVGGDVQAYIEAAQGQTHQTHYTVPANKWLLIDLYTLGVGRMAGSTDLHILGQVLLYSQSAWRTLSDIWLWNGGRHVNDNSATWVPPQSEIRQRVISTTTTQAHGVVGGYLVEAEAIKHA